MTPQGRTLPILLADFLRSGVFTRRIGEDPFAYAFLCLLGSRNPLLRIASNEVLLVNSERDYPFLVSALRQRDEDYALFYGWSGWFGGDTSGLAGDQVVIEKALLAVGWRIATDGEERRAYASYSRANDIAQVEPRGLWPI